MKIKITSFLLVITLMLTMSACGGLNPVEDAYQFIVDAATKTAAETNLSLDMTGIGATNNCENYYMLKVSMNACNLNEENQLIQGKSGRQMDNETTITMTTFTIPGNGSSQNVGYYSIPLNIALHERLSEFIKPEAEVVTIENDVRYVSCMMTFCDFNEMATGEIDIYNSGHPVRVRFYVDKDGYLCEMQMDSHASDEGEGDIFTSSFRYSNFGTVKLEETFMSQQEETVESTFPEGKDPSTLTVEMLKETMVFPSYTFEDAAQYAGLVVSDGALSGENIAVKADGTIMYDDSLHEDHQKELDQWTDIKCIVGNYFGVGIIGVTNDGTLKIAGFDTQKYQSWNTANFQNITAVALGEYTLYGLKKDGTVVATGENAAAVQGWSNVKQISADDEGNVIAVKNDGTVYAKGDYGIEDAAKWTDIVSVSAGRFHVAGLKSDGTVVVAGSDPLNSNFGESEVDDWTDIVSVSAGNMITAGLKKDGTVVAVGRNAENMNSWMNMVYVEVQGGGAQIGIRADGKVYGLGDPAEWDIF